jgi:hypothetical protein
MPMTTLDNSPFYAADIIRSRINGLVPRVAFILGSGLGELADKIEQPVVFPYDELPRQNRLRRTQHRVKHMAINSMAIQPRLKIMLFLQYFIWGAWLVLALIFHFSSQYRHQPELKSSAPLAH